MCHETAGIHSWDLKILFPLWSLDFFSLSLLAIQVINCSAKSSDGIYLSDVNFCDGMHVYIFTQSNCSDNSSDVVYLFTQAVNETGVYEFETHQNNILDFPAGRHYGFNTLLQVCVSQWKV